MCLISWLRSNPTVDTMLENIFNFVNGRRPLALVLDSPHDAMGVSPLTGSRPLPPKDLLSKDIKENSDPDMARKMHAPTSLEEGKC